MEVPCYQEPKLICSFGKSWFPSRCYNYPSPAAQRGNGAGGGKNWNFVLKGPTWRRLIKYVQAHIPGGLLYNRIAFFIVSLIPGRTDPHHRGPLPCFAVIQLECIVYIHVFLLKTLKSIFWHLLFVNTIRQSGWEESGCNRAGINKFKTMPQQHTEHDVKTEL